MLKRIVFVVVIFAALLFTSCRLGYKDLKLGYKNLKSGNWNEDTIHVAFNKLPEDVKNVYRNHYELSIFIENNKVYVLNNKIYGKEDRQVHGLLSNGMVEHTIQEKTDTLIRYVTYVDGYTHGSGGWRMGLYFKIREKKLFMPYWELRTPLVLYNDILYFPTDVYVDKESERKFKYKNFIGYRSKYYVAYRLKWLTNMTKEK